MATDIRQIQLTDAERRLVSELADRTGKPWNDVLAEALGQYRQNVDSSMRGSPSNQSWYDRLWQHGFVACLRGGPADLSTNPAHMEGFGLSDQ